MNMTRAILEGIHEVELQITPEFQKVEEPAGQLSYTVVDELLQSMGWVNEGSKSVLSDHPKTTVSMTKWHRPDMPGVYIAALRDLFAGEPGPSIYEVFSWRADWGKQLIGPHLKDVEDTAKFLAASHGIAKLGAMGQGELGEFSEMTRLEKVMEVVGWQVVASSGTGVLVYEHEGVPETIEVTTEEGDVVSAEVVFPDGKTDAIDPPTVENIVARAKAVKSWTSQ